MEEKKSPDNTFSVCSICKKPIGKMGTLALNPKTGKNEIMHTRCYQELQEDTTSDK